MVAISSANDSPYLVLWYLYLLFLAAVFIANVVAISIRKFVDWRTKRLITRYSKKGKKA